MNLLLLLMILMELIHAMPPKQKNKKTASVTICTNPTSKESENDEF